MDRGNDLGIYAQDQWAIGSVHVPRWASATTAYYGWVPAQSTPAIPHSWPGAPSSQPVARRALSSTGSRRAVVEGHQPAAGRRLRPVRQRPDGAQVRHRPLRRQDQRRRPGGEQPDHDVGDHREPRLDRPEPRTTCRIAIWEISATNGECGAIDNQNFGQNNPRAMRWSDDVLHGLGRARLQLGPLDASCSTSCCEGLSVTDRLLPQHRRLFPQHRRSARTASPTTWWWAAETSIRTASPRRAIRGCPAAAAIRSAASTTSHQAKFGQSQDLVVAFVELRRPGRIATTSSTSPSTRGWPGGARFGGGVDTGRSIRDTCFVVDSPQELLYCRVVTPFKAQHADQVQRQRADDRGASCLPDLSRTWRARPTRRTIRPPPRRSRRPSDGRSPAGRARSPCRWSRRIPCSRPGPAALDLRMSKIFHVNRVRLQINLDAYNALNSSSILLRQQHLRRAVAAAELGDRPAAVPGERTGLLLSRPAIRNSEFGIRNAAFLILRLPDFKLQSLGRSLQKRRADRDEGGSKRTRATIM